MSDDTTPPEQPAHPDPRPVETGAVDEDRRRALGILGTLATAAPAMVVLLTPSATRASGGSPPGDDFDGGDLFP